MTGDLFANPLHLVILLVVVLIIFGPGKLPGVGAALGKSVREFKKATTESDSTAGTHASTSLVSAAPADTSAVAGSPCPQCGQENQPSARFCSGCGTTLVVPAETVAEAPLQEPSVAALPTQCPDCQTENPPSSRFCAHCGKLLDAPARPVEVPSV